jgi:hypothetical protein
MTASAPMAGGLPLAADYVLADVPRVAEYREAANIWLQDDQGRFALPRFGVECITESWQRRAVQANIGFPDGRVMVESAEADALAAEDDEGRPVVFGAGGLTFRCIEPFARWTMSYQGRVTPTTVVDQIADRVSARDPIDVSIEADLSMAVPAWIRGTMTERDRQALAGTDEERFIGAVGGFNCKQLFTASGVACFGDDQFDFTATGLRVHRQGVRKTSSMPGHVWQSAVFASGKAFEALAFPDRPDGTPSYTEGYVFDGTDRFPAKVVRAPWLSEFDPLGEDVSIVLESALGRTEIAGVNHISTAVPNRAATDRVPIMRFSEGRRDLFYHQGCARYTWDGESSYGMIERSNPAEAVHGLAS